MPIRGRITRHDQERALQAIDYLRRHYREKISADALAVESGLHDKKLQHLFTVLTGYTVHRFHIKLKVEKAIPDIEADVLTIDEVATKHGFSSATVFDRHFKKVTGRTPSAYRGCQNANNYPQTVEQLP